MAVLRGERVVLRAATEADIDRLVAIRSTPEVRRHWRGDDLVTEVRSGLEGDDVTVLAIEHPAGTVVGAVQWYEEADPDYRHAGMDIYLDPAVHGDGLGTDALRTLCRHLFVDRGHHRLIIDPAADNTAAIACYRKVGFRPVGTMRQYEKGPDGSWHDSVLMDLLAHELDR